MTRSKATLLLGSVLTLGGALPLRAADWQTLPDRAPSPADNPTSEAKVQLGKTLFFDPRFSEHGTLSCNSCHNVMAAGDDNRPNSIGMHDARGGRSAPTVWNAAFYSVQFWDGRAATLEDQAKGPLVNPIEMGMGSLKDVLARIDKIPGYQPLFEAAFPGESDPITADNAAKAVAAFERTLITPNSPYDRYVEGRQDRIERAAGPRHGNLRLLGLYLLPLRRQLQRPDAPHRHGLLHEVPHLPGQRL